MLPKISPEQEQHFLQLLTKLADYVDDGNSPTDALHKLACEKQLPAGHVGLLGRAYNNGRTLSQIRNGETRLDKAASFPLIDIEAVLERMYPEKVKSAAELRQEAEVSSDYVRPPKPQRPARSMAIKAAAAPPESPYLRDPEMDAAKAIGANDLLRKQADEKRFAAVHAGYEVVRSLDKLASYFRLRTCEPFTAVQANVATSMGKAGAAVMNKLAADRPALLKQAGLAGPVDWTKEPYNLVKDCVEAALACKNAQIDCESFAKQAAARKEANIRPFVQDASEGAITGSLWDRHSGGAEKQAGGLGLGVGTAIGASMSDIFGALKPTSKDDKITSAVGKLGGGGQDDLIRDIRARTLLYDMMGHDPVISGYPHEKVIQGFNTLNELAPKAIEHRAIIQPLLRKYLESGSATEPFEMQLLMDLEKRVRDRDAANNTVIGAQANAGH